VKSFSSPWRDAANYRARARGVWKILAGTLFNEPVSVHRSAPGESNRKSSEWSRSACELSRGKSTKFLEWLSASHSGLLVELTESVHQFQVDTVYRGVFRFGVLCYRGQLR
jgi:hypothetical protein